MNEEHLQKALLDQLLSTNRNMLTIREGEHKALPSGVEFPDVVEQLRRWIQHDGPDKHAPFRGRAEFRVEGQPLVLRVQYDGKTPEGCCTIEVMSRTVK